jgi:hypothetical protein
MLQHILDDEPMQNIHSLLSERDRVTRLLTYLQARRALSMPPSSLNETSDRMSARKIVHECSAHMEAVDDNSLMLKPILRIIAVCDDFAKSPPASSSLDFYLALGAMRGQIADQIEALSIIYSVRR